jgi:hypothetical protein
MVVLFVIAGGAVACLIGIYWAVERLTKSVLALGGELTRINAKLEGIEAVNNEDAREPDGRREPEASLENAIRGLEKLRIDLEKPST